MTGFQILIIKLSLLLSFCGGPLLVTDLLKPRFGEETAFVIAFAPVGLTGFCVLCLGDAGNWGKGAALVGFLGILAIGAMNAFAIWRLAIDPTRADQSLVIVGMAAGIVSSVIYSHLALRRLRQ